ncbi:MAG: hypothetical protein HYZ08_01045 [Candidatus Kerfeldbacteria bacterium]|nr:hypothetical protein [Candidatus Kerfeldbacteria bacterium]
MGGINLIGDRKSDRSSRSSREHSFELSKPTNGAPHGSSTSWFNFLKGNSNGSARVVHEQEIHPTSHDASNVKQIAPTSSTAKTLEERRATLEKMMPPQSTVAASPKSERLHDEAFTSPRTENPLKTPTPDSHEVAFSSSRWSSGSPVSGGGLSMNLVPETEKDGGARNPLARLLSVVGVAVFVVAISWGVVLFLQFRSQQTVEDVSSEIAGLQQEITALSPIAEREKELSSQTIAVKSALDGEHYWSEFLSLLEETILPGVYWQSVTADPVGTVTLTGIAKDFSNMIEQVRVLEREDLVDSVSISSVGNPEGDNTQETEGEETTEVSGIQFTLKLKFDPLLISKTYASE